MSTLRELAVKKFGEGFTFTEAEERLLDNAPLGQPVDMRTPLPEASLPPQIIQWLKDQTSKTFNKFLNSPEQNERPTFTTQGIEVINKWLYDNNPTNADMWSDDRSVRAEIIKWVLMDKDARQCLQPFGLALGGLKITEPLDLDYCTIEHPMFFHGCALSSISLREATTKRLSFNGSLINGFIADNLLIRGGAFFDGVNFRGKLRLNSANIEGQLKCNGAVFSNDKGNSFIGDRISVKGHAFFDNVNSNGEFRLIGAKIEGQLSCNGADFSYDDGKCFTGDSISVKGGAFLNSVESRGEFRLLGANIEAQLACSGAAFSNYDGDAFTGEGISVKGSALFAGIRSEGEFRLLGANITGNLDFSQARLLNFLYDGIALNLQRIKVAGEIKTTSIPNIVGVVNLTHARAGKLVDDVRSRPRNGKLLLNGFKYESLSWATPNTVEERLNWLEYMPSVKKREGLKDPLFFPRPYEHLAKYYKQMGHRSEWREVMIAKNDRYLKFRQESEVPKSIYERIRKYISIKWLQVLGLTVAYGYKPWQAIFILLFFLALGNVFFYLGNQSHLMQPTSPRVYIINGTEVPREHNNWPTRYPVFNSLTYSLDTLIPFLDLDQEDHWTPDATRNAGFHFLWISSISSGAWLRLYLWFHIIMGWFFATLGAVSLTGIVRKDE